MKPKKSFAGITSLQKCIIPPCQNRCGYPKQAISFFTVPPTANKVYTKWSNIVNLSGKRTEKICEEHFRDCDFIKFERVKLNANAVPSLRIPAYCLQKILFYYNGLCCVKDCSARSRKGLARFPRKPVLVRKWKEVFGLEEHVNTAKLFVCPRHFAEKDFFKASSMYLKTNAVPSKKLTDQVRPPKQDPIAQIADHNYICPPAEMPRGCFISGCRTHKDYYERGVAMFSYPRDPDLIIAWNIACSREQGFRPPRYACVCEKHFNPSEIHEKLSGRCKLQRGAVPTRFLDGWKRGDTDAMLDRNDDFGDDHLMPTVNEELNPKNEHEPPNVEEVFISEGNIKDTISEVVSIVADMFCRMCGIKHEKDNNYSFKDLRSDHKADALINVCLMDCEGLEAAEAICPNCYHEVCTILDFLQKCHEGQQRLLEQLSEQTQIAIPEPPQDDLGDISDPSEGKSDGEEDNEAKLSDGEDDDTEEMKNCRMDRYIDRLIAKLKSGGRKSRTLIKNWECLDCREVFQHRTHLTKHRHTCPLVGSKLSKRRGPFVCELCDKVLNTLPGYRYHLMKMHDKEKISSGGDVVDEAPKELQMLKSNKILACPICTHTFRTAGELRYHLPSHKSTNQDKSRTLTRDLGSGEPIRTVGQYMCSFCGKMERSNAALETHMKFHLKQKDWPCDQCDKQYYTKADLKQHVMIAHDKITYTCQDCGTVLSSKATFTRHKRLHNESLLKRCTYCPKKFTTANALNKHVHSRHQGLQRPRLHEIELPEKLDETEEEQDTQWEELGDDRDGDAFEEIIEEVIMSEGLLDLEPKEEIKEDEYLFYEEDAEEDAFV
ncbi:uncharacterized protein LOC135712072 [Ochlerotatus camptorhynchus]|uniref:uncharacterized protein LOC135712072 n=1 Tax=Ochlerotatus camptorhynchus TaxID=644619 RepID=UPI0031D14C21